MTAFYYTQVAADVPSFGKSCPALGGKLQKPEK
jgi:hypothetical protein